MEVVFSEYASLFPARAGVILTGMATTIMKRTIPRTRGGDPGHIDVIPRLRNYSPHARG